MKPKIICHMMSSVDGRLIVDRWTEPYNGMTVDEVSQPYYDISHQLNAQAWMEGRVTIQRHFYPLTFEYEKYSPAERHETHIGRRNTKRAAIVLDPKGKILFDGDNLKGDNIITILSESVSEEYMAHLREKEISYLFAGADGKDISKAMTTLKQDFGIDKIVLQGGGIINGAFLHDKLIDELSLLIYPGIDGVSGIPSIIEYVGAKDVLPAADQSLELIDSKIVGEGVVWLYYKFHK